MEKTKLKVTMILKLAVLCLKQVKDSVILKSPTLFHPGNQRTMFPLGWGYPLHLILALLHPGQSSFPKKSAEAFTTGNKLKLIFNMNHLRLPESARFWGPSLHGSQSFLHIVGAKVPSALLFQIILSRILT